MAPGALTNPQRDENAEFIKQQKYLPWSPPNQGEDLGYKYDKVEKYDITKEGN